MRESTTYQMIVEEGIEKGIEKGRVEGEAKAILEICATRLGKPTRKVRDALFALREADLTALFGRVYEVRSWDELLKPVR